MAAANRTIYAILGLLAQGSKSGYEIKQVVEKTISHFWKESYGHLYPTLNKLLQQGMVRHDPANESHGRGRQRYELTDRGRAALTAWLAAPLAPAGVRNELALKLYFGQSAPPAISRVHLEAHREQQRLLLADFVEDRPKLEARVADGDPAASFELITLSLGVHIAAARIAWCEESLARLEQALPGPGV